MHTPAVGFMEHSWVNASLLWSDFGHRVLGAKTAVLRQGWPFCSAFSSRCSAGCRQPTSGLKLSLLVCVWGIPPLQCSVAWQLSHCLGQVLLISNPLVSHEVQMNRGLAEGLTLPDQSRAARATPPGTRCAKPLRELCALRERS